MARSRLVKANEKIAEGVTSGFQKMIDGVVGAYKKVEDAFVDRYLTHDGESVDNAKARIHAEQAELAARNSALLAQTREKAAQAQDKH